jgi:hypothetical protein
VTRMLHAILHPLYRRRLVLHFARELDPRRERGLHRHLARCAECRAIHGVLSLAEGEGAVAAARRRARLEAALFASPARPARRRLPLAAIGVASATVLAIGLVLAWPRLASTPIEVREKGGGVGGDAGRSIAIAVYERSGVPDGPLVPVRGTLRSGRHLAFTYTNRARDRFDRLMIFALDEKHTVYWYYPAHLDPRKNPTALPIRGGVAVALPEEVAHRFEGTSLRLYGVFTRRRDLTVRLVEETAGDLHRQGVQLSRLARFPLEGTAQHTLSLKVSP